MRGKILILLTLTGFSFQSFANDAACNGIVEWLKDQPEEQKTWDNFKSSQIKNFDLSSLNGDQQDRCEAAFDFLKNRVMRPDEASKSCREILSSRGGRALDAVLSRLGFSHPPKKSTSHADATVEGVEGVYDQTSLRNRIKAQKANEVAKLNTSFCDKSFFGADKDCYVRSEYVGIPASFDQIMKYEEQKNLKLPPRYSVEDCDCLDKKIEEEGKSKFNILNFAYNDFENLKKEVVKAAGQKFINDYASYVEDIQFYATNQAFILASKSDKFDESLLCQDFAGFEKAVNDECTKNGTMDGKDARVAAVMGSFGDAFNPSGKDFQKGFKGLLEDINTYTEDVKNVAKDRPNILTRKKYEEARFALSRDQFHVPLVENIITVILRDDKLKANLMESISNGKSPMFGILEILSGTKDPALTQNLLEKVRKGYKGMMGKNLKQFFSSIGTSDYQKNVDNTFHLALNLNPGLKNIMMNPRLFQEIAVILDKSKRSVKFLEAIENEQKTLTQHFQDRCQNLQKNLAALVCTKNDNLLKQTRSKDIVEILEDKKLLDGPNKDAYNLMICSMNKNEVLMGGAFDGLNLNAISPYSASDYLDRKLNPNDQNNAMANMLKKANSDSRFASQMSTITQRYNSERVSAPNSFDEFSSKNSNAMSFSKPIASSANNAADVDFQTSTREISGPGNSKSTSTSQGINIPQSQTTDFSNGMAHILPTLADQGAPQMGQVRELQPLNPSAAAQSSQPQQVLKEVFSEVPEKQKIHKLVDNIKEKDAEELLALKEENARAREQITELKLENERKKTQELKEKYDELERRFTQISQAQGGLGGMNESFARSSFATGGFSPENHQLPEAGAAPGGQASNGSSSFNLGNFRDIASAANAVSGTFRDVDVKNEPKLVISSSRKDPSGKVVEDPSSDLISYLKNTEPDGVMLKKIKESGIIYTYETEEKDGQKVVKQKLIKYDELSPEAKKLVDNKLAVIALNNLKRAYSVQALRLELMTLAHKKQPKNQTH